MTAYVDTSFLLKLYVFEAESAAALDRFSRISDPVINTLTDVEVASALFRKLPPEVAWPRTGAISRSVRAAFSAFYH